MLNELESQTVRSHMCLVIEGRRMVPLRNADPRQRFLEATGQYSYARFLALQRTQEESEVYAVSRANESEVFPTRHRPPGI